ncbi:hypothetical protein FB639_004967 [Coemansia asiatica]|nr:hypothetical protein FB639_004967 [Coemansia asiatica]
MVENIHEAVKKSNAMMMMPIEASTPLQLLPPLQSISTIDQSALQPSSISSSAANNSVVPATSTASSGDSGLAGALCIMVWNCVEEQRTSCGSSFTIAEAMKKVDSQQPFALVDGWPTATTSGVTSALPSSSSSKRQRTRR